MVTDAVPLPSFLSITASCSHVLPLLAGIWIAFHAPGVAAPLAHKGSVIVSGEYDPHWSFFTVTPTLTRTTGVGPALHWLVPQTHHQGGKKEQHTGKKKTSHQVDPSPVHPGGEHPDQGLHPGQPQPDQVPHPDGQHPGQEQGSSAQSPSQGSQELWSLVSLTQRLHRWNGEHYQANLWAGAGVGLLTIFHADGSRSDNRLGWSPWAQADWETRRLYLGASARWFQAADIGRLMTSARAGVALTTADYNRWQPWLMLEARTMEGLEEGVEITPILRVIHRRILAEAGVSTTGAARFNLTYTF
jgi:hypothetical protein